MFIKPSTKLNVSYFESLNVSYFESFEILFNNPAEEERSDKIYA